MTLRRQKLILTEAQLARNYSSEISQIPKIIPRQFLWCNHYIRASKIDCPKIRRWYETFVFFLSPTLRALIKGGGGPPPPELMADLFCHGALRSTEQSTLRGGEKGEKVPRKGEKEGRKRGGQQRWDGAFIVREDGDQFSVGCVNAQPFLCNELGPFQASLGNFQAMLGNLLRPFSGDFRHCLGNFSNFG